MGDLTRQSPKCLLEVASRSIVERALQELAAVGVTEAVLVVGYGASQVRRLIGPVYAGMHVEYVVNDHHADTNTAYSLWLARDYLSVDCILVEGDILFDYRVMQFIVACSRHCSAWAGVPVGDHAAEGVLLRRGMDGRVSSVELVRTPTGRPAGLDFKCAGIQLVRAELGRMLANALEQEVVRHGRAQTYADLVLGGLLHKSVMTLCSLDGMRWAEVDTPDDLSRARRLFASTAGEAPGASLETHQEGRLDRPS